MLRLAWPVLLEQSLVMLVGLVDTWLASRYLQADHLAAIGLMSYIMWFIPCLFGALAIGATALIARQVGAGKRSDARHAANQAMSAGFLLSAIFTLLIYLFAQPIVALTQLPEESAALTVRYLQIYLPAIPAAMCIQIGLACLHGAGDTLSGFAAMSIVNLLNLVISAGLVTGAGPFPALGWEGLAIGTTIANAVGGLLVLGLLLANREGLKLKLTLMRPNWPLLKRLFRIGLPGGLDMLAVVFCHFWFIAIINSLGTLSAAAHGLGIRIESLAYLPGTAFQVAAATLAGQYLGAGEPRRATRGVLVSCLTGGTIMTLAGISFFFQAELLTGFFLGDQTRAAAELTVPLLRVVALSMPSLAITMVITGGLRGAGDTRGPLLITFLGFLLVRIPLAYYLAWEMIPLPLGITISGWGLGVVGAWYAMVIDIVLRSLLVSLRFWLGNWQRITV